MNRLFKKLTAVIVAIAMFIPMTALAADGEAKYEELTISDIVLNMGEGNTLDLTGLDAKLVGGLDAANEKLMSGLLLGINDADYSGLVVELGADAVYALITNQLVKVNYADIPAVAEKLTGQALENGDEIVAQITEVIKQLFEELQSGTTVMGFTLEADPEFLQGMEEYADRLNEIKLADPVVENDVAFTVNGTEYTGAKETITITAEQFSQIIAVVADMYKSDAMRSQIAQVFSTVNATTDSGEQIDMMEAYDTAMDGIAKIKLIDSIEVSCYTADIDAANTAMKLEMGRTDLDLAEYIDTVTAKMVELGEEKPTDAEMEMMKSTGFDMEICMIGQPDAESEGTSDISYGDMSINYYFGDVAESFMTIDGMFDDTAEDGIAFTFNMDVNVPQTTETDPENSSNEPSHVALALDYAAAKSGVGAVDATDGEGTFTITVDGEEMAIILKHDNSTSTDTGDGEGNVIIDASKSGETFNLLTLNYTFETGADADAETCTADVSATVANGEYGVSFTAKASESELQADDMLSANDAAALDIAALETRDDIDNLAINMQAGLIQIVSNITGLPGVAQLLSAAINTGAQGA